MATKVPTEILIKILNNLIRSSSLSTQDLYSSLLVNRFWCKVTIPILWELLLSQECCTDEYKLCKKALCIRTYISCMDTQARTLLAQNGFDLSSSPSQATFDYPSFTHKLIINNLVYFISIYSHQIISPDQDNNNIDNKKPRILFRETCKLIIRLVDTFKMTKIPKRFYKNYLKYIDSLLKLLGAPKKLRRKDKLIRPLTLICDNILNMDLYMDSVSRMKLLKLISVQKRLENLSIVGDNYLKYLDHDLLLMAIISQKETLKSLRLKSVNFYTFKEKSSPIGQFISLRELNIENCYGLYNSDCLSLASSFTQLSSFHCFHSSYAYNKYPQEFIIKILQTANSNLKNICLYLYPTIPFDIFSAILNYCTNITELTLYDLSPEQVIAIFNNNFNELRSFSFDCGWEGFDANELLCQMAKKVPELLETIKIKMNYDNPWIFNADSLRKFFEGWCCCKGGNKKFRRLRIEPIRQTPFTLEIMGDDHFKAIEEYGIQFDMEK